jgi:hypothetical protein
MRPKAGVKIGVSNAIAPIDVSITKKILRCMPRRLSPGRGKNQSRVDGLSELIEECALQGLRKWISRGLHGF